MPRPGFRFGNPKRYAQCDPSRPSGWLSNSRERLNERNLADGTTYMG